MKAEVVDKVRYAHRDERRVPDQSHADRLADRLSQLHGAAPSSGPSIPRRAGHMDIGLGLEGCSVLRSGAGGPFGDGPAGLPSAVRPFPDRTAGATSGGMGSPWG